MYQELEETAHWDNTQLAEERAPRRAWLTVLTGSDAGRVYPLEAGRYSIGRGPHSDIVLVDKQISRDHTCLEICHDGSALIWDCASRNGTMIGSRSLNREPCDLRDGAKLQIGGAVILRFSFRDPMEKHFERKLYDSATRDSLTGAYNKRYFADGLRREYSHAARTGQPLSLIVFDLDNFKNVNDTWGHPAGDYVLRTIIGEALDCLRDEEILCRFGGEEFALLLRHTSIDEAVLVAERLRRLLRRMPLRWQGSPIPISASFGVASTDGHPCNSPESLLQEADTSLYRAKRSGKNRVCCAPAHRRT